jgi:methionyl-tRNA formyltransferase
MRIVFMGTPESAVPSLRRLIEDDHEIVAVWTQPDKPAGRHHDLRLSPVKQFAQQHNLSIHQPAKIKTQEAKDLFASHQADVGVVVAYGKILTAEFLSAPRHGCVNLHFSLLPKYRGAAPVNWAIVKGENETGVTTMRIVEALDAGPILRQRSINIGEKETAPELMERLSNIGAELLSETITQIETIEAKSQNEAEATFAPMLKREDGLVDWSMDAFAIERRVRGFQPWPGAFTTFRSRRLMLRQALAQINGAASAAPGTIIEARGDKLLIACGSGSALQISEIQMEGARRLGARDFINGAQIAVGEVLGL